MDDRLQRLLDLAFDRVPAIDANLRIEEVRASLPSPKAASYELLIPEDATFQGWFLEGALPKLVYHLDSRGNRPPAAEGIFLSLFAGETLHFVHARDALKLACDELGIDAAELLRRHGTGESHVAVDLHGDREKKAPLMLPGSTGGSKGHS